MKFDKLYYIFSIFVIIYLGIIVVPILRTLLFTSINGLVQDSKSGIIQSIELTYLMAFIVAIISVVFAIPYTYFISRSPHPFFKFVDSIIELPIMIPHTVVGIIMLLTFEPSMPLGSLISKIYPNYRFDDTFFAVIVTLFFLASAYSIRTIQVSYTKNAFEYENMARSFGYKPLEAFMLVSVPFMWRSILRGMALTWARSISEVGSMLIVAYYIFPSFTHLVGVFIYSQFIGSGLIPAAESSSILIITGLLTLLILKILEGKDASYY